ncbi:protein misato homolog 1 [Parasteatoda tepidariorum]|uniref:protein misato homolog 1 n=1 Tax=Parasteatoda tepidariorum TaxID=114398 RepID=UPI00077FB580|nr:protein misato homolog 1 [Parasteatoda tepidariorum]
MPTNEIITIQAGNYANFVGTHWWNIQESSFVYSAAGSTPVDIDHDVMFSEGSNLRGDVTYTPRLVLIEAQDNFRNLPKESSLYRSDNEDSKTQWDGFIDVIKKQPVEMNPFLEGTNVTMTPVDSGNIASFEHPSTSWSYFLRTNLHPSSLCLVNELCVDDLSPYELYSNGEAIYSKNGEQFEESLRKMGEDCDCLQGFQLIYDAYNGFSGITGQFLQHLDDEYKRRPSLCFPVYQDDLDIPIDDVKKQKHRLYAILLSMSNMNSYCTFFSPLSLTDDVVNLSYPYRQLPCVQYNEKLLYHTSAIFAAAIETLSSPFRLRSGKHNMYDATNSMATYGRKLVSSSVSLPFPLGHDTYLSSMVETDVPEYYMTSLSPYYKTECERTIIQSAVLRGVPADKFQKPGKYYHSPDNKEIFGEYLNKYSPSSVTTATILEEKCSVAFPFPKIFKNIVSDSGFLNSAVSDCSKGADKIPLAASFSSSDSASQFLEDVLSQANKNSFKEYIKCSESSFDRDSYREVIENLIGLQDNYTNY